MHRVRSIAGKYGSRFIEAPKKESVHPMSERMRGALFNMLGNLEGKAVLDAFAGSGAIGLEAASRGAQTVTCIEQDRTVMQTLLQNVESLRADGVVQTIQANVFGWVDSSDDIFDIVIADPPYERVDSTKVVEKLKKYINASGFMILSHSGRAEPPRVDGVVVVETRSYADGTLTFYQSH